MISIRYLRIKLLLLAMFFSLTIMLLSKPQIVSASEQPSTINNIFSDKSSPSSDETNFGFERRLSLFECFSKADNNNKEIAMAASNLSISQAGIIIAKAIPNPTYNMSYGFGPAWKYIIAGNNQQFGWNEEIQIAGRRSKKIGLARSNYLQTAFEVEAVRFDVHNRVRRAYAELTVATAYAKLTDSQENTFRKLLAISQNRFAAGKAPGSEVLQAKLNITQLETQRNQAQGRLVADSAQLAFLLGESPKTEEIILPAELTLPDLLFGKTNITPEPGRGLPPLVLLLPTAWRERNDLKAAIQQAYVNHKALTLAKTQRIPDPFLGFNYMISTYTPFQEQYYTPQPNAQRVPFQPGYMATFAQETPIFYQYKGEINQAKATWIQQLKQNDQLRSQTAADIVSAYEALLVSIINLNKFQKELLPAALQAAQMSRRSYEVGKTDLATAILAQQQYGQLASSYFDCAVSYQNNWADLEKAVGVPLNL